MFRVQELYPSDTDAAAGADARAAAGVAAGAAASAATVCTYYVIIREALRASLHLHDMYIQ